MTIGRLRNERILTKSVPFPRQNQSRKSFGCLPVSITSFMHDNSALVTVHELGYGAMRFSEMRQALLGIPAIYMLVRRLVWLNIDSADKAPMS